MSGPHRVPGGWTSAYAELYRAGAAEFPPACLHYVLDVVRHAARGLPPSFRTSDPESPMRLKTDFSPAEASPVDVRPAPNRTKIPTPALSASEVIAAFRAAARTDFGLMHDAVLDDWGLRSPTDLGRAVALLGRAGCLTLDDGDAIEFYAADELPLVAATYAGTPAARPIEQEAS